MLFQRGIDSGKLQGKEEGHHRWEEGCDKGEAVAGQIAKSQQRTGLADYDCLLGTGVDPEGDCPLVGRAASAAGSSTRNTAPPFCPL